MEVRPRHSGFGSRADYCSADLSLPATDTDSYKPGVRSSPAWRRLKREVGCTLRTLVDILTGRASKLTYLLAPVLFAMSWVLIILITGSRSVSFHDRMAQSKREYEAYHMKLESQHKIIQMELPPEGTFHVVVAMPFLDVNPLAGEMYIKMVEWMLIYSTIPLTFHVLTNGDSVSLVHKVMAKINNGHSHGDFDYHVVQLTSVIDQCTNKICPEVLKVAKPDFCEVLMGRMTPLLFPWLFPHLDHAIYVDRNIVFQGNLAEMSHDLSVLRRSDNGAGFAMAPEQTLKYRRAFAGWQVRNPSTKLGRPPPEGRPGYNADLILMDLAKLRRSAKYKSYLSETKLGSLVKMYQYLSADGSPDMGDVLNIIAADSSGGGSDLIQSLSCRWNRNTSKVTEEKEFNVCPDEGPVLAWNGQPDSSEIVRRG